MITFILVVCLFLLFLKAINKDKEHLGDVSTLKLKLKDKDKEIENLKRDLVYYKNRLDYEEYLKD